MPKVFDLTKTLFCHLEHNCFLFKFLRFFSRPLMKTWSLGVCRLRNSSALWTDSQLDELGALEGGAGQKTQPDPSPWYQSRPPPPEPEEEAADVSSVAPQLRLQLCTHVRSTPASSSQIKARTTPTDSRSSLMSL